MAKFWLKRIFSSKFLEKLLKVNLRVEAKAERLKGLKGVAFTCTQVVKKEAHFSTMNCTAVEQSCPQAPRLWAGTGNLSPLLVLYSVYPIPNKLWGHPAF